ncbi:PilT protein domain protein [Gemmatirosa kalamazoonensis]|uniref:PilT protein domain protein n=1 Tax=Gemmatirosa kalamazoonensis TaxID=861299 RepID=W0RDL1_9BACT|nr:type II toxin-antitoxin system VapC family toxin [Gemmatirosa kalamazoonensis]AHG89179.1 PilT protein domain protein [Gemmatirosa kalamazoonensis]
MTATAERLLLDSHVFLWWSMGDERVRSGTRRAILDAPEVYVSMASLWELAIKASIGKLRVGVSLRYAVTVNHFTVLPVSLDHVERVANLPHHHRDPFDRMLAAQALHEGLTLVTHDRSFAPYALPVRWT